MQSIEAFSKSLSEYLPPAQIEQVTQAYFYAEQAHEGQSRRSGEAYITHPLAVASILAEMHMDAQSLMAAMLHDVIEDTEVSKSTISELFGEAVAEIVDGVSKLAKIEERSKAEAQAENFQKMALAMSRDIRVILVKLADRLHNMRTLGPLPPEKRRRIAHETLDIYAPIANRLGMNSVRIEFEDLGFAALHPMRARRIAAAVRSARGNRKEILQQLKTSIDARLSDEGHRAHVLGREKHLFSIYRKMRTKKKSFSEIMDVYAFRIVVEDVDACYRALGAMHNLYKPVAGHFKDYIAIPKANGYQSLHTILFGLHGVPVEIQIRTQEMEDMANSGIAAHWLYKSDDDNDQGGSHMRARRWVQGLLELQQRAGNSQEFIEHVKNDLFPDEVYLFTPKGGILELPHNATAVDFAYAVHTDVGNNCVACRINRRLAPLSEPLESGQTVEIITAKGAQPNPSWLSFVVSGKARSNIRHFLKTQQHSESISLGRRLLKKELISMGANIDALDPARTESLLNDTGHSNFDFILEDIGLGNRVAYLTALRLVEQDPAENDGAVESQSSDNNYTQPFVIRGAEGLMINFGRCCHSIPGDAIIGHLSAGRGIVVHRDGCKNIAEDRNDPERCVPLSWSDDISDEFQVELCIEVQSQRGILAEIATKISSLDVNISKLSSEDRDAYFSTLRLEIGVTDRIHLAQVMRRIRSVTAVRKVIRTKN